MEPLRYPYRPKSWVMALAGSFFLACAIGYFFWARDNDRGLIINGLIELDTGEASIFYWALFACCVAFVAMAIFGIVLSLQAPREVAVDARGVTLPAGRWSRESVTIPFDSITDLHVQQVNGQKFLTIRHKGGKHGVSRAFMPRKEDFETFVAAVAAGVARQG